MTRITILLAGVAAAACTLRENPLCDDCSSADDSSASGDGDHGGSGGGDGGGSDGGGDGGGDGSVIAPDSLRATGLCVDNACTAIAPGIHEFLPRWQLWSGGAEKRRWIYLPPGTQINTSDADYWRFPIGTKLWKDFVRDGVRVETRYMAKTGPADADWDFMPYAWSGDGASAVAVPGGASNVRGTSHDIPAQATCLQCHSNVKSRVLGFGALQLDYAAPAGLIDLDDAVATGWLSTPCPGTSSPRYPVPGNEQERAALGYLHANCGHCHNSQSPLVNRPSVRLETTHLTSLVDTRTYRTTVNVSGIPYGGATVIAKPGDPDGSIIVTRMMSSDPKKKMPWLGAEQLDPMGHALIRAWITSL